VVTGGNIHDDPHNDLTDAAPENRHDGSTTTQPDAPDRYKPDQRQTAIKSLLANADGSLDDKLATVKTAHHVDKDRFQSAFRSLMTSSRSK
jgi:hypothetical protein